LLAATGALGWALVGCATASEPSAQPGYRISAAQLQQVLEQRFPRRFSARGVLDIDLGVPRLRFLAEHNRLGAELPLEASGPALRRRHPGDIELDFGLRYEPSDLSVRAHQIRVNAVRIEGLGRDATALLRAYADEFSQQAFGEIVLHRLRPRDLALPSTMGLEPGDITVTPQGLVISLVPQK
jgi:hypothetical protein